MLYFQTEAVPVRRKQVEVFAMYLSTPKIANQNAVDLFHDCIYHIFVLQLLVRHEPIRARFLRFLGHVMKPEHQPELRQFVPGYPL